MSKEKDQKRFQTVSKVMEKFWLATAIVSFVFVLYVFYQSGGINGQNVQYLVFPLLAGVMYAFRKTFRTRMEKQQKSDSE